jgi:DNA-binding NtrC family response regulator
MTRSARILVVDDEATARTALADLLREEGLDIQTAADGVEALDKYESYTPHVVITDLNMPGMDGIELVKKLRAMEAPPAVIVTSASGAADSAMRLGVEEYLTKPLDFEALLVAVDKVLANQAMRREIAQLRRRLRDRVAPGNMVGSSPPMQRVFEIVDQVAPLRATVLITGESGTGKELVANALHQQSPRADKPFIKLHCAAIVDSLGQLSLADGGTVFLDEIGELSTSLQVKLLDFLQEPIRVDVRVIAASNRNLADEVAHGTFHDDLFHRLDVVNIEMPPLRERRSDIPALAKLFVDRYAKQNGTAIAAISPKAFELLVAYDWPGNVRELENAIERSIVLAAGAEIEVRHLPQSVRRGASTGAPPVPGATMAELERYAILETMKASGGSTSKAAQMLGISARTIQYRLHQYQAAQR